MLELAAPFRGVGEIAVVAQREFAFVAVNRDGLRVEERFVTRGRITRVADGQASREFGKHAGLKNLFDFAHGTVEMKFVAVARNDAG